MNIYWYISSPDGYYPWNAKGKRSVDYCYIQQVARAVEYLGYTGVLLPTGTNDVWVLASSLISITERLRFLIAIHPVLLPSTLFAKMSITFDRLSNGRLDINIVNGDSKNMTAYGCHLDHNQRYLFADEYLAVWKKLITGQEVNFAGNFITLKNAFLEQSSIQKPHPPLYLGGSSNLALEVASKHIDTHLSWGESPIQMTNKIQILRALTQAQGRILRFGIRLYVIVRESEQEAWNVAEHLFQSMNNKQVENLVANFHALDLRSVQNCNQKKFEKIENFRDLEFYPNLWAGLGLICPGSGAAIVGDSTTVANLLQEYIDIGVETFILSGLPLLEEAYRFAELVFPLLSFNKKG